MLNIIQFMLCFSFASIVFEIKRDKEKAFIEHYEKVEVIWDFWRERSSRVPLSEIHNDLLNFCLFFERVFQENKGTDIPNMT